MNIKQVKKIIDSLDEHWIDFCPRCGEKIKSTVIITKDLRKILRKIKGGGF